MQISHDLNSWMIIPKLYFTNLSGACHKLIKQALDLNEAADSIFFINKN